MNEKIKVMISELREEESRFWRKNGRAITRLLETCRSEQGEYLPTSHGPGSWATTYSSKFLDASSELFIILMKSKNYSPVGLLAKLFRENNIKSCRGAEMSYERAEYLYRTHLAKRVAATHRPDCASKT